MNRIAGTQARDLLDGTTPGPWEVDSWDGAIYPEGSECAVGVSGPPENFVLAAAAPALAETVAWLYGRRANVSRDIHSVYHHNNEDCDVVYAVKGGTIIFDVDGGHRTVEEAEEFARAILAVVDEARRG